jgi:PiT family inorganic phosphate transporter
MISLVILIIIIALCFDFLNGANDRANAIATTCATKALSPTQALIVASIFDMLGAFASTRVAETVGKGIIPSQNMTLLILLAGTLGAVVWVFFCTKIGLPISVSHALVGGLLGAGLAAGGAKIVHWGVLSKKVFLGIVLGPAAGFLAGAFLLFVVSWILYSFFKKTPTTKVNKFFRIGQIFTTPFMSFTHGMNDTQNAMGIITAALLAGGFIDKFYVPWWVRITCGTVMGLGTFLMGWRVVKTLGWKLTKVEPKQGFVSEFGAGAVIALHSFAGMPISTTHVVCSSVIGGTALQNLKRVKQIVAQKMMLAWIITVPSAALFSALSYYLVDYLI